MTDAYDCYCINLAVNLIFFKINKICCYLLHVHMTLDNCHRQQKTTTTLFNLLLYNREIYILYYIILYYVKRTNTEGFRFPKISIKLGD